MFLKQMMDIYRKQESLPDPTFLKIWPDSLSFLKV